MKMFDSRDLKSSQSFARIPFPRLFGWRRIFPQRYLGLFSLESFKMASNGLVFRAGRGPSFILVGLVVVVIILFYSYWGVSSKNNKLLRDVSVLQDRLRVLAARKLTSDKKSSALVTQLTQMQNDKEKIEEALKSRNTQISDTKKSLHEKEQELAELRAKEKVYNDELVKLRQGMNSSSSAFRALKGKGELLLKKHKEIKANHSAFLEKISKLEEERDHYKAELSKMKLQLEEEKNAKVTVPPRVTEKVYKKSTSRVKTTSGEKGSENLDEEKDNKDIDLPEKSAETGREVKPMVSMMEGNASSEARITSPPKNISSEVQGVIGNKSQSPNSSELKPTNQSTTLTLKPAREEDESVVKKTEKEDESDDRKNSEDGDGNGDKDAEEEEKTDNKEDEQDAAGDDREKTGEEDDDVNDGQDNDDNNEGDDVLDDDKEVEESLRSPKNPMLPNSRVHSRLGSEDERPRIPQDKMMRERMVPRGLSRESHIEEDDERSDNII